MKAGVKYWPSPKNLGTIEFEKVGPLTQIKSYLGCALKSTEMDP